MNIFVTGGTGYVGEQLAAALLKRGDRVYLLCRSEKSRQIPEDQNLQVRVGDILDPSSLAIGMKECEAVIHLAAYAKNWSPKASMFHDVNVTGTRNVFERALEQLCWARRILPPLTNKQIDRLISSLSMSGRSLSLKRWGENW